MKIIFYILSLLFIVITLHSEESLDTFRINHGDNYIIDDYPDFNNRGFRYYQDYVEFSSFDDGYKLLVNTINGNLIYCRSDFVSQEIGLPINLTFTYNSGSSFRGRYGNFWQSNYGIRLISNNANKNIIAVYPDDRTELFLYNSKSKDVFSPTNYFIDSFKIINNKIELSFFDDFVSREKTQIKAIFDSIGGHFPNYLTDKYGNSISYQYSESGKIQTINFPSGRNLFFQYDGELLSKVIVPGGREINYTYNENNDLIRVSSPSGEETHYFYDECNHLIKIQTSSREILISYDDNYRVNAIQNHYDNLVYFFNYDTVKHTTTLKYPNNSTKYFKYDNNERSIEYGYENNIFQQQTWNDINLLSSISDAENRSTKYQYDSLNHIISIIEPDNKRITYNWDYNNNILHYNYKGILSTNYQFSKYNDINLILKDGTTPKSFYRDMNGLLTEVKFANDVITNFNFDVFGKISRVSVNNNEQLHIKYNIDGLISEIKDISGNSTYFYYDDNGRLINIKYPDGNDEGVYYSDNYLSAIYVKQNGETVNYSFDSLNRITNIQDEINNLISFNYTKYNQIELSLGNINNIIKFNNLRYISEINLNGKSSIFYDYNSIGLLSKIKYNGSDYSFKYNNNNLISEFTNPAGLRYTYSYNDLGLLTQSSDELGNTTKYNYDALGNMIAKSIGQFNIILDYYLDNRIKSISYGARKFLSFIYDEYGLVKSKIYDKSNTINYEYDKFGLRTRTIINNSKTFDYFYNSKYALDSIYSNNDFNLFFKYDKAGKIIEKSSNSGYYRRYLYDNKSRLISISNQLGHSAKYSWDKFNNLSSFEDFNSNEYLFSFNQNKISITYPNQSTYSYEGLNFPAYFRVDKIFDTENTILNLLYSNNSKIINIVDYYSNQFKIHYLTNGLISSFIKSNNENFQFTYDNAKRLININNPENHNKTFTYNSQNQISELNDYSNFHYQLSYYNFDLLDLIKWDNFNIKYSYNDNNLLSEFSINDNVKLFYYYDNFGNISSISNQNNDISKFYYNAYNQLIKKVLPNNETIEYSFNNNNLVSKIDGERSIFNINYDKNLNLSQILLNSKNFITLQYNSINKISNSNSLHNNIDYSYNSNNLLEQISRKDGYSEQYSYDYLARMISRKIGDNERESFAYEKNGNISDYSDMQGLSYNYSYNYKNQLTKIRWSKRDSINIIYDNEGNIIKITQPNGISSYFSWLANAQLHSINIFNSGNIAIKYNSNAVNLITASRDTATYHFDNLNRFAGISGFSSIKYDNEGKILFDSDFPNHNNKINYEFIYNQYQILPISITINSTNFGIKYDDNYRLSAITLNNNNRNEFSYEKNGLLSQFKNQGSTYKFDYINFDKISRINLNDKYIVNFNYLNNQLLNNILDNFANTYSMNYDNLGNLSRITKNDNSKIEYLFDNNANMLIKRNESYDETAYYYNEQNLLKSVMYSELNSKTIDYDNLHYIKNIRTDRTISQNYGYKSKPFNLSSYKQSNINDLINFSLEIDNDNSIKLDNNYISQKRYSENKLQSIQLQNGTSIIIENYDNSYKITLPDSTFYLISTINDSSDKINIYDVHNSNISELIVNYHNNNISEIIENSQSIIKFDYDDFGRVVSYFNHGSNIEKFDYLSDGRISKISKVNDSIIVNYDSHNRISIINNIELTYDLKGNIIKKYYLDSNKSIDYSYNSDAQLRFITIDSSDITELFYSASGKLIAIKNKNYQFKIPIFDEGNNSQFSKIQLDTLGNITQIRELVNYNNINLAYKYILKSKEFSYPIFSRDLTTVAYIQNGNFVSLANNIAPFNFMIDSTIDKDLLSIYGMQYLPELNLYYDGTKFYDSEIYSYLQDEFFLNRSLKVLSEDDQNFFYAIPEENLIPIIKPHNNRFYNLQDEANPNHLLASELNHHFNNFLNYNTLLFSNNNVDKENQYHINKISSDDLLEQELERNLIITAKLPNILIDTILLQSNYNIIPKLMPKRPKSNGIRQVIDYLNLCSFPKDAIVYKVLNSIMLDIENRPHIIRYNNIHSANEPSIDLALAEQILDAQNSFRSTLIDNLEYMKFHPNTINYMEIIEKYLPEYFEDSQNNGLVNILKPYRITNVFKNDFTNIDNYIGEKAKLINSQINFDMNELLKKSFDININNSFIGKELYRNRLIPLPYKVYHYPNSNEPFLQRNYINFNK